MERGEQEAFDRLTRLATISLRTPTAVLGGLSGARMLIRSQVGMPGPWSREPYEPLPHAMFRHALATSKAFAVDDVSKHPLTRDMAQVPGWEHAAYCGVPIVLANRRIAGVLAVFDANPRPWAERDIGLLRDLAASAAQEIDAWLEAAVPAAVVAEVVAGAAEAGLPAPAPDGFLILDRERRITRVNARAAALLRREPAELIGTPLTAAFPGIESTSFLAELERAGEQDDGVSFEAHCDSLRAWLEVRAFTAGDALAIHVRDVSARRETEEALRQSEARYRGVFQDAPDAIVFTAADGTFTECNLAMLNRFGHTREHLFRMRLADLFADDVDRDRLLFDLDHGGSVTDFETSLVTRTGEHLDCAISASARRSSDGAVIGYHAIIEDRTERNREEQQLVHDAFHDPLTGLPNRALFMDRLDRVIVQAKRRTSYRFAMLFVDLDRFKLVNDTMGHMAGDELLVAVARRLERCLRAEDTVARFGGDEFAILLASINDARDATRIAERINFELARPFRIGKRELACSASIGIALSASGYESGGDVLHDADAAMYRAKSGGRARYELFDAGLHARAVGQLELEKELRSAVEHEEFEVFYQPIVALDTGTVVGIEALMRWRHPERGLLVPADFLGVAEQTGLIVPIGWLTIRDACRRVRQWQTATSRPDLDLTLGINLSARQFSQPNLVARFIEVIEETGFDAARLRLELTEQVVLNDPDYAFAVLAELEAIGARVVIDDFGTGHSSLMYLQRMPISALKIDSSFISALGAGIESRSVVRTMIALGESLAIDTIAEGVETLEQLQELRTLGVRLAQGSFFCEPLDAESASGFMNVSGGTS